MGPNNRPSSWASPTFSKWAQWEREWRTRWMLVSCNGRSLLQNAWSHPTQIREKLLSGIVQKANGMPHLLCSLLPLTLRQQVACDLVGHRGSHHFRWRYRHWIWNMGRPCLRNLPSDCAHTPARLLPSASGQMLRGKKSNAKCPLPNAIQIMFPRCLLETVANEAVAKDSTLRRPGKTHTEWPKTLYFLSHDRGWHPIHCGARQGA